MKIKGRVRVHPLFAAVATAVIFLSVLQLASITGKLEQWIGDNAELPKARKNTLPPADLLRPPPSAAQSNVDSFVAINPLIQRKAILTALGLGPPAAGPPLDNSSDGTRTLGGTASGATAGDGGR